MRAVPIILASLLAACIPTAPERAPEPPPCELTRAPGAPIAGGLAGDSTAAGVCPSEAP